MADATAPEIYAIKFGSDIYQEAKQGSSLLIGAVHNKGLVNGKAYTQPRIGTWSMSVKGARGAKNAQNDPVLSNRFISMQTYEDSRVWTAEDEWKTIAAIGSPAFVAASDALGNQIDQKIISALGGTAYAGEGGGTSVTLPSTQKIAAASSSLTVAKVMAAALKLDKANVSKMDRYLVISPAALHQGLLADTKVGSVDYMDVKALISGTLGKFYGFNIIVSNNLTLSSTTRYCYAFHKNAISIGFNKVPTVKFDELVDQSYDKQVFYTVADGAGRLEEVAVVEIAVIES